MITAKKAGGIPYADRYETSPPCHLSNQWIGFIIEFHLSHFFYYELKPQSQSTQLLLCR